MVPPQPDGFSRLVAVAEGMTPNRVFDACRKRFPCWRYTDNLDAITNYPSPTQTYAVWFRDRIEADEELANKSPNDLAAEQIATITPIERLLLELAHFRETEGHLDIKSVTLLLWACNLSPVGSSRRAFYFYR